MKALPILLMLFTPRTASGVAADAPVPILLRPKGSPLSADLLDRSVARRCCLFVLFTLLSIAPLHRAPAQGNVVRVGRQPESPVLVSIAEDGRALMPIRVADDASPRVRQVAKTLADYLKRISGADFAVASEVAPLDPRAAGITVGSTTQITGLAGTLTDNDPKLSEDYLVRTHGKGLILAGATDLGVEHAVWDVLYRLGHRQFFPGPTWEIVPAAKTLKLNVSVNEHPAYRVRRIWFGGGLPVEKRDSYAEWSARNRAETRVELPTGHAYDRLLNRNKAAFAAHPEYYGVKDGQRYSGPNCKICISNPGLRELVVADSLKQFANDPQLDSISLDPSDGTNWCECDACAKMGSVTDRVVMLNNQVAEAVEKQFTGKLISMYAYSAHSPPPTLDVHPNIVVSIATNYIRGGYTLDQLLEGWSKKTKALGIREYYAIFPWDKFLPGQPHGSSPNYFKTTIPKFYTQGARYMSAESTYCWGSNGLGYYLAARILWDLKEADHVDALVKEFLDQSFGPARGPMAEWFRMTDGSNKPLVSTDLVGRMYRALDAALKLTDDPAIRRRIYDLAIYTRYSEIFINFQATKGPEHQAHFEQILRLAWRARDTEMLGTNVIWDHFVRHEKNAKLPSEAATTVPDEKNPWKTGGPFSPQEIEKFIADGIAHNAVLDFQAVNFSDDLIPATPLHLTTPGKPGEYSYVRGPAVFHLWAATAPLTVPMQMRSGIIYQDRGAAKATLYARDETIVGTAADQAAVQPDKEQHDITLKTRLAGAQRIEIEDGTAGTGLTWKAGQPAVIESSLVQRAQIFTKWSLYFYVPKGTRIVGGYGDGQARIKDGSNQTVKELSVSKDHWSVVVPPGEDGKLWRFEVASGQFLLMTVPPYLARNADELLLPAEVVKADALP